jgi:uncharacterized membrane protein YhaH (DUF805 family)
MDGWYVGVGGQQKGPLSLDDAVAAARSAGAAQTYVWREGFGEWKIATDVPEFANALRSSAPSRPVPPPSMGSRPVASDTQFSGEYSGTGGRGVSFVEAIKLGFANYVKFGGRSSRSEFWFWTLFGFVASIVASIFDAVIGLGLFGLLVGLALIIPGLSISFRRLHDTDRTAWWLLLGFIPLVGAIVLIVWFCTRGTSGPNRYGEDPLGG